MSDILPESPAGWIGYIVAAATILATWWRDKRKSDVDESALVLGKWKELVDAHEAAIKRLTEEFDRERKRWQHENDRLQLRVDELEGQGREKDAKIKALEDEVSGLKRSIAQNSQSTAMLIGAAERYTHNKRGGK